MQQAQATQAGAFGGGREAIQRAERERGLMGTLGGIQARGSQAAYDQAANQFRQGISQGMGINQLQNQYGGQMQQQAQRPLDMAYQDFQNQQNYPYKQLGFMSDLVRGMPLGQKSTSTMYEQGPGMVQTLAGLGGAAYGFGKSGLFGKEGGLMSSYADGGEITDGEPVVRYAPGGVTSQDNKDSIVEGMYSIQGLMKAKAAALARRDVDTANAIDERIAELNAIQAQSASIDRGLGSAFNQIPEDRQETMRAANGGIVAFAGGGTYKKQAEDAMSGLEGLIKKYPTAQTPEEYESAVTKRIPMMEKIYGPDVTKPYLEETKAQREKLPEQMEKDVGLAFAAKSLGLLARRKKPGESQKDQFFAGLGEVGQEFAGEVGRLRKESREADDKLRQSEITLTTAQQARKEGLVGKAIGLEDKSRAEALDGYKSHLGVQKDIATIKSGLAGTEMQGENALRVAGVTAAAGERNARISAAKETDLHRHTNIRFAALVKQGKPADEQTMAEAAGMAAGDLGKYSGVDRAADARAAFYDKISDNVDAGLLMDRKYRELQKQDKKTNGNAAQQYREQRIAVEVDKARSQGQPTQGQPAPNAPAQQQAAPATPIPVPPQAVDILKKNPSPQNIEYFDKTFGPGAAARALGK
jgi:hypothetical protein